MTVALRTVGQVARAGLLVWVLALVTSQVAVATGVAEGSPGAQRALMRVATASGSGLEAVRGAAVGFADAESDIRRTVEEYQLRTERFIAKIP